MAGRLKLVFVFLWSFVLFRTGPVPVFASVLNGDCTLQDSPLNPEWVITAICSGDGARVEFTSLSTRPIYRIDYVCTHEDHEQITGAPWQWVSANPNWPFAVAVSQPLQLGTNCTFYVCYYDNPSIGRASPASCITDIDECATNNGGCEHNCTNTIGGFNCSCGTGYELDGNGLNCTDIDECDQDRDNCHVNATCVDVIGSFSCTCNHGFEGDGINCTNINECESEMANDCDGNADCMDTVGSYKCSCRSGYEGDGFICTDVNECDSDGDICSENANCTNLEGSFNCTCNPGYTGNGVNCTTLGNVHQTTTIVVVCGVITIALLTAVLCGVICAVHRFWRKDTSLFEIPFKDEVIDLKYHPVSTDIIPKLYSVSSMISMFENLRTIPKETDTDTATPSKTQHTTKVPDTVLHQNSPTVTADIASSNNVVNLDELTAGTAGTGYVDCPVLSNTFNLSLSVTDSKISSTFHLNKSKEELYSTLGMEADAQNDATELAFSGCNSPVVSDAHAVRHTSTADLSTGYATCTATLMPFNQSSDFMLSEDLSMSVLDLKDPGFVSKSPQSVGQCNEQSFTFSTEKSKDQEWGQTSELQFCPGYLPSTHLLSSTERSGDVLACQSPEGSSSPSMSRRDVVGSHKKSPPNFFLQSSQQHCRTKSESSLDYFNHSNHNQFNTSSLSQSQYLSASSGYIIDCSGFGARENGQTLPATTCNFPLEYVAHK